MRDPGQPTRKMRLAACGFLAEEIDALEAAATLWNMIVALPEQHPSERKEACSAMHRLQDALLARPGARALGWPRAD